MKKIIRNALLIFIMTITFPALFGGGNVLAAIARNDMPTLTIRKLAEFPWPEGGTYLEGGTAVSNGYLTTFLQAYGAQGNPMLMLDSNTWQLRSASSANLSHANDMCYIPGRKEIYVTPMDRAQILVLDEETLELKETIDTLQNYHAIGYDAKADRFAAIYASGTGAARQLICDILDGTCKNLLNSFTVDSNLTYQGLGVRDSLIYYSCWERGSVNATYEPVYDQVLNKDDNVVYVYDFSGKLVKTLLIEIPEGYTKFEIETVSFIGDRMILQFNETLNDENRTCLVGIYEAVAENKSASQLAEEKRIVQEQELAREELEERRVKIRTVSRKKRSVQLLWKEMKISGEPVDGYEVQICRKKRFKGETLRTIRTGDIRYRFRGLNRRSAYYIRVRAYKTIGDKVTYSRWSKKRKVYTK